MVNKNTLEINIGDWEQDTNCIRGLLEFCLLKLSFKLHKSQERGVFIANIRTISLLFKTDIEESRELLAELSDNNILNIEEIEEDRFCIKSRRMIREANISSKRSEVKLIALNKNQQNPINPSTKPLTKPHQEKNFVKDDNIYINIEYIVKLLNSKSGKNFSLKTTKTKDLIKARLNEGFTKEDFEKVISQKCNDWLDDPKYVIYLRPETLFGNKFEGYLQSCPSRLKIEPAFVFDTAGILPDRKVKSIFAND